MSVGMPPGYDVLADRTGAWLTLVATRWNGGMMAGGY